MYDKIQNVSASCQISPGKSCNKYLDKIFSHNNQTRGHSALIKFIQVNTYIYCYNLVIRILSKHFLLTKMI